MKAKDTNEELVNAAKVFSEALFKFNAEIQDKVNLMGGELNIDKEQEKLKVNAEILTEEMLSLKNKLKNL